MSLCRREDRLFQILTVLGPAAVAFSGGTDSAYLAYAAKQTLGDRCIAVTVAPPYVPKSEVDEAERVAAEIGIDHFITELPWPVRIRNNPPDRCYLCKETLLEVIIDLAREKGFSAVAEGSNTDDLDDYRPGRRAVEELGVRSPLLEAGMSKADIRIASRQAGLSTWDKPAFTCLLTRLPHNAPADPALLERIGKAERFLLNEGFVSARVRYEEGMAVIEVAADRIADLASGEVRERINRELGQLGFRRICVDLGGYRRGSMNPPGKGESGCGEERL
ncbi:MAG: ATP-dependent sacrificial sulfur transferase LarE [Spirochaetia bacterium]